MKTRENYQIQTATINNSGEKKLFQLKLPRNAKKITGILITVHPTGADVYRLRMPESIGKRIPLIPIEHAI